MKINVLLMACFFVACAKSENVPMVSELENHDNTIPLLGIPVRVGTEGQVLVSLLEEMGGKQSYAIIKTRENPDVLWGSSLLPTSARYGYTNFNVDGFVVGSSFWSIQGGLIKDVKLEVELSAEVALEKFSQTCNEITEKLGDPVWIRGKYEPSPGVSLTEKEYPFFRAVEALAFRSATTDLQKEYHIKDDPFVMWKAGDSADLWAVFCSMARTPQGGCTLQVDLHGIRGNGFEALPLPFRHRVREFTGAITIGGDNLINIFASCDSVVEPVSKRQIDPGHGYPYYLLGNGREMLLYNDQIGRGDAQLSVAYINYAVDSLKYRLGKGDFPVIGNYHRNYGAYFVRGKGFVLSPDETLEEKSAIYFTQILEIRPIQEAECP